MPRVFADDANDPLAFDHSAVLAKALYRSSDFHTGLSVGIVLIGEEKAAPGVSAGTTGIFGTKASPALRMGRRGDPVTEFLGRSTGNKFRGSISLFGDRPFTPR